MPTSSIFTNVVLTDEQSVKILIEAFEEAEKRGPLKMANKHPVMTPEEVDEFFDGTELEQDDIKPTFEEMKTKS